MATGGRVTPCDSRPSRICVNVMPCSLWCSEKTPITATAISTRSGLSTTDPAWLVSGAANAFHVDRISETVTCSRWESNRSRSADGRAVGGGILAWPSYSGTRGTFENLLQQQWQPGQDLFLDWLLFTRPAVL